MTHKPVIVVHGGAGSWSRRDGENALKWAAKAAASGFETMLKGGGAVDAVVEAVALMEDSGVFNAGCGSTLNLEGRREMEAFVMDGRSCELPTAISLWASCFCDRT